jgi:hypothetical protein
VKNLPVSHALLGSHGALVESTVNKDNAFDTDCDCGGLCKVGDQWCRNMCSHYRGGFFMDFEDGTRTFIVCSCELT